MTHLLRGLARILVQWDQMQATQEVSKIKSSRGGKSKTDTLEERSTGPDHPALMILKDGAPKEVKWKLLRKNQKCYSL